MSMGRLDSDLEELYRRRQGAFQVMLASVAGSVEGARDVVQEAFARALQKQDGFRGEGSLEAWVWRIAFRVAVGSTGSHELAVEEVPEVAFVDESGDPTLAAAMRALPPQRRMAIFLRYFADLSYAEIGPAAMLSRATAGVLRDRLVISTPGSSNAVGLAMEKLIVPELAHYRSMLCAMRDSLSLRSYSSIDRLSGRCATMRII
jgi:RNA polymerase sigma factor (sigma-70 family)